ncbi:MAG: [FeFe] hydrogenase H-cluster maturation GTPase HydF [Clostridia bacterium]|nr:[FeFe] hydrogenase H-cluster maturation GTPase HydF [Clostridia bacterium]
MSMNQTPRSVRKHIAILGRTNAGKSSIINAITEQNIAIVSDVMGTTTDPVYKSIEILPLGPCVIIDTAGLDDRGKLGELRKKKTLEVLNKTDVALIVIDAVEGVTDYDIKIADIISKKNIPFIVVVNKMDVKKISRDELKRIGNMLNAPVIQVSSLTGEGINELREKIASIAPKEEQEQRIVGDLLNPGDFVLLVTPIDQSAPKGRLILPQQQTIRDILDSDAVVLVTKEYGLKDTLKGLGKKPKIVITDSQVFSRVSEDTPEDIMLTSFSILFARYKGDLQQLVKGARAVENLKDGDKILISEACTHHRQEDDIGRVKIPAWITKKTGKKLIFEFSSGSSYTDDITRYSLVVHCAGCMLNRNQMMYRINYAEQQGVPIVNYGVLIAYVHGILDRALQPFI